MTNTIQDGTKKQFWLPRVQRELDKRLVAKEVSEVYTGPDAIIHNPYASTPVGSDGTATLSYSIEDYEVTDDTLAVTRRATSAEHIDNIEQLQQRFDLAMQRAERQAYVIKDKIDQYIFNLPVSMSGITNIDDGDFAGTVGNPYASSNSVIDDIANTIIEKVGLSNGAMDKGMFWVVSPYEITDMASFMQNNGFTVADSAIKNGYMGQPFAGLDVYVSNNLTHEATLGLATNPTATDTVTIAGVKFTFVSTIGTTAGNVLIGVDADASRANLATLLAALTTTTSTGVAVSTADAKKLQRMQLAATNDATGNTLAIVTKGTLSVGETLTASGDVWTSVARHTIAGVKGSIFLALPSEGGEFEKKSVSGKHGKEVVTSQIYAGTIWNNFKPEIYDVVLK